MSIGDLIGKIPWTPLWLRRRRQERDAELWALYEKWDKQREERRVRDAEWARSLHEFYAKRLIHEQRIRRCRYRRPQWRKWRVERKQIGAHASPDALFSPRYYSRTFAPWYNSLALGSDWMQALMPSTLGWYAHNYITDPMAQQRIFGTKLW
jgi:hypothetical protein